MKQRKYKLGEDEGNPKLWRHGFKSKGVFEADFGKKLFQSCVDIIDSLLLSLFKSQDEKLRLILSITYVKHPAYRHESLVYRPQVDIRA